MYELTEEHRAQLKPHADKWIARALRTETMSEKDREIMRAAMRGLYAAAELDTPEREVFGRGAVSTAIAGCLASVVWWARDYPDAAVEMFGGEVTEQDMARACAHVCRRLDNPATQSAAIESLREAVAHTDHDVAWREVEGDSEAVRSDIVTLLVETAKNQWSRLYCGGAHWASYPAFLSFFREVAKLDLPIYEKWIHYERAAIYGGPRMMHKKFWIVSDFPAAIRQDEVHRPPLRDGAGNRVARRDQSILLARRLRPR